jgi:hypothetical protein
MIKFIIPILILCFSNSEALSQNYHRVSADFTVKIKSPSGGQSLSQGRVYYDRGLRQIIYNLTFPEPETWVSADTILYRIQNGKVISRTFSPSMADFSVFHLALSSHLQNFGLNFTKYEPKTVTREGDQVITTWMPPLHSSDKLGKILVSARNKQLFGVVFFDPKGVLIRKQFFEDYQIISGLSFPGKIVEINIFNGSETYQVTTFKNIVIDESENDNLYYYPVGSLR